MKTKIFATRSAMVNLYGRLRTARANRIASSLGAVSTDGFAPEPTRVPQTAHCCWPAPIIEPQLRHIVGRPIAASLVGSFGKFQARSYANERDASRWKASRSM